MISSISASMCSISEERMEFDDGQLLKAYSYALITVTCMTPVVGPTFQDGQNSEAGKVTYGDKYELIYWFWKKAILASIRILSRSAGLKAKRRTSSLYNTLLRSGSTRRWDTHLPSCRYNKCLVSAVVSALGWRSKRCGFGSYEGQIN